VIKKKQRTADIDFLIFHTALINTKADKSVLGVEK